LKRALLIALALLFFGALSISAVEGGPEVASIGESMWWSFATVMNENNPRSSVLIRVPFS